LFALHKLSTKPDEIRLSAISDPIHGSKPNIRVSWYESRGRRAKTFNTVQRTPKFDADYAGKGKWKVRQQLINLLIAIRDNVFPKINHFELAWCSPVDKQEEEEEVS
jgi:hypothetical protein